MFQKWGNQRFGYISQRKLLEEMWLVFARFSKSLDMFVIRLLKKKAWARFWGKMRFFCGEIHCWNWKGDRPTLSHIRCLWIFWILKWEVQAQDTSDRDSQSNIGCTCPRRKDWKLLQIKKWVSLENRLPTFLSRLKVSEWHLQPTNRKKALIS